MENLISSRKMVIETLLEGRELANQLQSVLAHKKYSDASSVVENLVMKILKSFSNALYILNEDSDLVDDISVSQIRADSRVNSSCLDSWKSVDSPESWRSTTTTFTMEDRSGCHKKRKIASQSTWNIQNRTLIDDGHAWRKYGEKVILNAKYHRNYFRCTHKADQNCQATKQVQRIQEDPPLYQTTYFGHHTCKSPELILECCTSPSHSRKTSTLISFDSTNHTNKQEHPFRTLFSSINKHDEFKEEMSLCDHIMNDKHSSSSDYVISPDPTQFESPMATTELSSPIDYDSEDVISKVMESVDFDYDILQFEFLMGM